MSVVGAPLNRVDGKAKVTGAAKYSAEFQIPNLAYAVLIESTVPSGSVANMDTRQAARVKGVLAILTPANALKLPNPQQRLSLLQDNKVYYNNQPIGVVVAESLNAAWHAASLVRVRYRETAARLALEAGFGDAYPGHHNEDPGDASWGNVDGGLAQAEIKVEQIYTTPIQHHSPMEPHAAIAQWQGDHLTLYASTQNITGHKQALANMFGIADANVRVVCLSIYMLAVALAAKASCGHTFRSRRWPQRRLTGR